jgi:hypothetical protein
MNNWKAECGSYKTNSINHLTKYLTFLGYIFISQIICIVRSRLFITVVFMAFMNLYTRLFVIKRLR